MARHCSIQVISRRVTARGSGWGRRALLTQRRAGQRCWQGAEGSAAAKHTGMRTDGWECATWMDCGQNSSQEETFSFYFNSSFFSVFGLICFFIGFLFKARKKTRQWKPHIHGTSIVFGRDLKVQVFFISADGLQAMPTRGLGYQTAKLPVLCLL